MWSASEFVEQREVVEAAYQQYLLSVVTADEFDPLDVIEAVTRIYNLAEGRVIYDFISENEGLLEMRIRKILWRGLLLNELRRFTENSQEGLGAAEMDSFFEKYEDEATPYLVMMLSHDEEAMRRKASQLLLYIYGKEQEYEDGEIDYPVIDQLVRYLKVAFMEDSRLDWKGRTGAVHVLFKIGGRTLIQNFLDNSTRVCWLSGTGLSLSTRSWE